MARSSTAKKVIQGQFQPVKMGLGEAIQRLIQVEWQFRSGVGVLPQQLLDERALLLEALDTIPVEVGFDCNADGIPDTVEIFEQAVATSCCRLMLPGPPVKAKVKKTTKAKKATTKRKTPTTTKAKVPKAPRKRSSSRMTRTKKKE